LVRVTVFLLAGVLALGAQEAKPVPAANPFKSAADVARGKQLFGGHCAPCHGPAGEGGRGVSLARATLPRASTDAALFTVVREGLPGTEMPAGWQLAEREVWQVAAFVRTLGRVAEENVADDRERGAQLFRAKGGCIKCHTVGTEGGSLGPPLNGIGLRRTPAFLRQTLADPAATLPDGFLRVDLVTNAGRRVAGIRLHEDTFSIQVRDFSEGLHSYWKSELTELKRNPKQTPMPGYGGVFSGSEMDDVVAYLASLRGAQ
jgi:putative heme-binding domain-containing protein